MRRSGESSGRRCLGPLADRVTQGWHARNDDGAVLEDRSDHDLVAQGAVPGEEHAIGVHERGPPCKGGLGRLHRRFVDERQDAIWSACKERREHLPSRGI